MDKFHIDVKPGGFAELPNDLKKVFGLTVMVNETWPDYVEIQFKNEHQGTSGMLFITRQSLDELAQKWLEERGRVVLTPGEGLPGEGDLVLLKHRCDLVPAYWIWGNEGDPENPMPDYHSWHSLTDQGMMEAIDDDWVYRNKPIWYALPEQEVKDE